MNPTFSSARGYLLLEDGRRFPGLLLGAHDLAVGEVVFNTSMTGYQEILTDPSYAGQLLAMTYPLVGNTGVTGLDSESAGPQVAGFIVREASRVSSSWRGERLLGEYLREHEVVGLADVDTRALTLHIRSEGAIRGAIVPDSVPPGDAMERICRHPRMEGLDLASTVSTVQRYEIPAAVTERFRVLALDLGIKSHSSRLLSERGCRVTVLPSATRLEEILQENPSGLFVSNGPGDPAAVERTQEAILRLSEAGTPVFGICLGHQLIARAFGGTTYKLPFGHRGANHPVRNLDEGGVEITAQNHGFAVAHDERGAIPGAPDLRVTHVNLNDGTVEGLAHRTRPVFAVQYHPEGAPGPHDSRYLFDRFVRLMENRLPVGEGQ